MMKLKLVAAAFSLSLLAFSSGAFAEAGHNHNHEALDDAWKEKPDEHASALGTPGDPAKVTRTIAVNMTDDMRFSPAKIAVKKGETIKFVVKNSGRIKHEMVLGSASELKEHAAMMKKMPGMEHADENMVVVDPGKTGEIVWHFTQAGNFDFACLQPGHFEAGMKGKLSVSKR